MRWETELFEVVEALTQSDGTVRYRLEPWADRHIVRAIEAYDESSDAGREAVRAGYARNVARRRLAILLSPLLGHLPGAVQDRMESEFGAPAVAMTIVSALPLFVLGFVSFLFSLAAAYGAGYSAAGASGLDNAAGSIPSILPVPVAAYLAVESFIRLGGCFILGRPFGSLLGALLYEAWRTATRRPPPPLSRSAPPPSRPSRSSRTASGCSRLSWGSSPPQEQDRLELRFGMETLRWSRITALLLLAIGGLNVAASVAKLAAGIGRAADVVWLIAGTLLSIEQILRLREVARGRPAGSFLAALVRPLARDLLR